MKKYNRILSMGLAVIVSLESVLPAMASPDVPQYDETLYVTMDPYGEIKESSIVKNYQMNGNSMVVDYGVYDKVMNLTDHSEPVIGEDGSITFSPEETGNRFYFEGRTKTEKSQLPWDIKVSYRLNGVEKKAEELAGEKGLIEVNVDLVPNQGVSDYYRNNMALMASTVVDMDKNLSLEAEGAQVQSIGNLNMVVFFQLPGEEGHYSIRIGTDDFKFSGLIFTMVPLTVSQLDKIEDLRDAKETMEDSADAISDSLDVVLDSMGNMQKGIADTADGLRGLDRTRQIFADSKGKVYENADEALAALDNLSQTMRPFYNHTQNAGNALNEIRTQTNHMVGILDDLSPDLGDLQDSVRYLRNEVDDLRRMAKDSQTDMKSQAFMGQVKKIEGHLNTLTTEQQQLAKELASLGQSLPKLAALSNTLSTSAAGMKNTDLQDLIQEIQDEGLMDEDEISSYLFNEKDYSIPEINALTGYLSSALATDRKATPSNGSKEMLEASAPLAALLPQIVNSGAGLTGDLGKMLGMTEMLMADLHSLRGPINGAINGVIDIATATGNICDTADDLINSVDGLNGILNRHHDEMIATLNDIGKMTDSASRGIDSMNVFFRSLENQMKVVGDSLNSSTEKTLNGLAGTLDEAGNGLNQTEVLRNAKNTIKDMIDDKWDEYTIEDTTILNIDLEASPMSMTSAKNPSPRSIQMILRTEEIKDKQDSDDVKVDEDFQPDGNFFHRVGNVFKYIWRTITSVFK
ncbi:hypothetical protein [Lacrimispora sphenoides]|uniref:Membrane protein n=1 Tax=Lacrimispora sphenoides JCM 1415 TaxID=1297793 RepID=A0ABY1C5P5_9FIRM|nr:hypothetical protein [Lacrimispora sphenoides]SET70992.1 putative membrane protein [[Clostridium] sphenoides JCM 1415]SUY50661.1 membrane protein-like protein [Lacrimispora sphenoides]